MKKAIVIVTLAALVVTVAACSSGRGSTQTAPSTYSAPGAYGAPSTYAAPSTSMPAPRSTAPAGAGTAGGCGGCGAGGKSCN